MPIVRYLDIQPDSRTNYTGCDRHRSGGQVQPCFRCTIPTVTNKLNDWQLRRKVNFLYVSDVYIYKLSTGMTAPTVAFICAAVCHMRHVLPDWNWNLSYHYGFS